jgi:hypothetical protein
LLFLEHDLLQSIVTRVTAAIETHIKFIMLAAVDNVYGINLSVILDGDRDVLSWRNRSSPPPPTFQSKSNA